MSTALIKWATQNKVFLENIKITHFKNYGLGGLLKENFMFAFMNDNSLLDVYLQLSH